MGMMVVAVAQVHSAAHAGCLAYVFGSGNIHDTELDGCTTPGVGSLCLYGAPTPQNDVTSVVIKNSKAGSGGAVWASSTTTGWNFYNVRFENVEAATSGGGFFLINDANPKIDGVGVLKAVAKQGGALFIQGSKPAVTQAKFMECASLKGAGVYVTSGSVTTIDKTTITGCHATGVGATGGALQVAGGLLTLTNSVLSDGSATAGGGLIGLAGDALLTVSDTSLTRGSTATDGACLHVLDSASARFTRTQISHCTAGINGGVMRMMSTGRIVFDESSLSDSVVSAGGGGIGILDNGYVEMHRTTVKNGYTSSESGCFGIYGGNLIINGSTLDKCTVPSVNAVEGFGFAGGFSLLSGSLEVRDSTINNFEAKTGAILRQRGDASSRASFFNVTFTESTGVDDNGFYLDVGSTLKVIASTISPRCTPLSTKSFIGTAASTNLTGIRGFSIIAPTGCARRSRQLQAAALPALVGEGSALATCAENSAACGKSAVCDDSADGPVCTCKLPKVPNTEVGSHTKAIAPYVGGCRDICPGGQVELSPGICGCREGLYLDDDICIPCPIGSWSLPGSAICDVCPRMQYKDFVLSAVSDCKPCMDGAECELNALLGTLKILPTHWRLGSNTTSIHKCLIGANGTSACVGGSASGVDGSGFAPQAILARYVKRASTVLRSARSSVSVRLAQILAQSPAPSPASSRPSWRLACSSPTYTS